MARNDSAIETVWFAHRISLTANVTLPSVSYFYEGFIQGRRITASKSRRDL
jgi:hypothetical protein